MEKKTQKLFINFSNHPSAEWNESQIAAALQYGDRIIDIPFPVVNPHMDEAGVHNLAGKLTEEILSMGPSAVMCQGEFGLSYAVIKRLLAMGIIVLYACSERKVISTGNVKTVQFDFIQFRRYV